VRDGLRIEEEWVAGALVQRRFTRERAPSAGEVLIEFSPPDRDRGMQARIENGGCGYSALLDTLVEAPLP